MTFSTVLNRTRQVLTSLSGRRTAGRRRTKIDSLCNGVEFVERRQLLSATGSLDSLSDEFDGNTVASWQRIHEAENWNADQLQTYDINQTQPGRMVMAPYSVVWYQDYRGPMAFKEVTGDFVVTTQIRISDRDDLGVADADDIPNEAQFSLGGVMIRTPRAIVDPAVDWQPGSMQDDGTNNGENYVFLSLGHGTDGQLAFEVKSTRNSNSQLELTSTPSGTAVLQIARIGTSVITLLQEPGQPWVVHRRYSRPDMPTTMQVGLVSYTDWGKASDFAPFYHNSSALVASGPDPTPGEPFNPDLVAAYDYARFQRPQIPASLQGLDLTTNGTDEELLSFLGDRANVPAVAATTVRVEAVASAIPEDAGFTQGFRITRSGSTSANLTLHLQVSGTATGGNDYSRLPTSVTIPAGADRVDVPLAVVDDDVSEGSETIDLSVLDTALIELANPSASLLLLDNDFPRTGPLTVPTGIPDFRIDLADTDSDGRPMSYQVQVVDQNRYPLDQQYDFWLMDQFHEDWGGQMERWIRGNGQDYFYLLPGGELYWWQGSFASSRLLADFSESVYQDPSLLVDVPPLLTATIQGNQLALNAAGTPPSTATLMLTKSNGLVTSTEQIPVEIVAHNNTPPRIAQAADVVAVHDTPQILVPLQINDAEDDELALSVVLLGSPLEQLHRQYGFQSDGNYHEDWGGQSERWIRATSGSTEWFYLLPDGTLYEWKGSFAASQLIASLEAGVYHDPRQLTAPATTDATVALNGSQVVLTPGTGFVGKFAVQVTAADAFAQTQMEFTVALTNEAPHLQVPNLMFLPDQGRVTAELVADDADGDQLSWTIDMAGTELDQLRTSLQLQPASEFHTNWGGRMEKWVQNVQGEWFYLLSDGTFWQWEGGFETSRLLTTLDSSVYDDPQQLLTPAVIDAELDFTDGTLTVTAVGAVPEEFDLRISISDGIVTVTKLIRIQSL